MSDYDLGFSDCLREQECLQAEIEHERDLLKSEVERLRAENERLRDEVGDHERWLTEMCEDYRLQADPHTVSRRLAINGLIHALRGESD